MPKKKIFFIINSFSSGGVEHLLLDILKRLNKNKFEIHLFAVYGAGPLKSEFERLRIPTYFVIRRLPRKGYWIFSAPLAFIKLVFLFHKIKPQLVVTSFDLGDFLGIISAWFSKIKQRVIIQHDVQEVNGLRKMVKIFCLKKSTQIIAISNTVRVFLEKKFTIPNNKVIVIHNGIDIKKFSEARKLPLKNLALGIVGRLESVKGHIYFLKALVLLKGKNNLKPTTYVVGGGGLEKELKDFCKEHNLDNTIFTGQTNEVPSLLKKIDVLIVPSLHEGFCLAALEGLFAEKIVIASDIDAIKEFIVDNQNGILFAKGDVGALADVLYKVLTENKFRNDLSDKVKKWAQNNKEKFDLSSVAKNYEKFFDSLNG